MKARNDCENKTLEILENDYWGDPNYDSYLVTTCHQLRKKKLSEFEVEDLRIMIGQDIGLKYLIPKAIDILSENILTEGDCYQGDLLHAVLRSDENYWKNNREHWRFMKALFKRKKQKLMQVNTTNEIRRNWFETYDDFKVL